MLHSIFLMIKATLTQCGNFRIFLPLKFYVKSILVNLKSQKLPYCSLEQPWIFNIWEFHTWRCQKRSQKFKIQSCSTGPNCSFLGLISKWPKLISRNIWVAEKSWNFHIVYSQLGCPCLYYLNFNYLYSVCYFNKVTSR